MNNNKTHQVEKLSIINAKQCSCRADKNPYRHDGRADKDTDRHNGRAYSLSCVYSDIHFLFKIPFHQIIRRTVVCVFYISASNIL